MARLLIVEDNHELGELIAATARGRGHRATVTPSGKQALAFAEGERFDAAVVDLLLPDTQGSRVLQGLAKLAVPAVAVSGVYKGARFAEEATRIHGAVEFLEKPFAMNALIEAVERAAQVPLSRPPEPEVDDLQDLAPAESAPAEAAFPIQRTRPTPPPAPASGQLSASPVPRLLNAYYEARHHGELKLWQGQVIKVVYFEAGRPVYAASNLAPERFARFCMKKGILPEDELKAVAELAKSEGVRTGEAMIRLGMLTEAQRKELLERQVREIIWSTFRWTEGQFHFAPKRPNRTDLVRLSVFPGDLILAGVEHEFPLVELRQRTPADRRLTPAPDPSYELHELALSADQARLIAYADGTKKVEDLLALSDLSEHAALATLTAFQLMGLLEPRSESSRRVSFAF